MLDYYLFFFIPRTLEVRALNGQGSGYSFGDDFYPVWLGARQWRLEHRDLYNSEMTREIQIGLFGRPLDARNPNDPPTDYRQFAYPAFTEMLLWPAALLDFPNLRLLLAFFLPILTAASIWFWLLALQWHIHPPGLTALIVLTLCTYEVLEAFFALQPGLLVFFFLASAALALRRNRLMLAGVLMSLTLIKPQVTLLAVMYMLIWSCADRRRSRFWIGFFAITICLTVSSLWIWPHWPVRWIGILLGYHRYAMPPLIIVLPGRTLNALIGPALIAVALLASAILAWRNRHAPAESPTFWWTLSVLLAVTSVALLPGLAIYDHVILIPAILLLLRDREKIWAAGPAHRILLSLGSLVLFWPWVAAFALLLMRAFAPTIFYSPAVFVLPIRTAASLPFAVLALLAWTWRLIPANPESA